MPRRAVDSQVRLKSLNLKTTDSLRAKLEQAAAQSGRALTHEVESRLLDTFKDESLLEIMLGKGPHAGMMKRIVQVVEKTKELARKQKKPPVDKELGHEILTGILYVAQITHPDGGALPSSPNASGDVILKPEPGDVGLLAAWTVLNFMDAERFDNPREKGEATIKQIMARRKGGPPKVKAGSDN